MQSDESYRELDDEVPIGSKLSNDSAVYFIQDRFFPEAAMIPVKHNREKIGSVGCSVEDTVLSVKLRVQAQFGFPVSCVDVRRNGFLCFDDETLENDNKYRIDVKWQ